MNYWPVKALLCALLTLPAMAWAEVCAEDRRGVQVCLPEPAKRIATLSPGATELMFAAGAGEKVVAVVNHSDYPPRSEEHTSELQSRPHLVCRLLLEKKKNIT